VGAGEADYEHAEPCQLVKHKYIYTKERRVGTNTLPLCLHHVDT
jgi:hypothetical protein